MEGTRSKALAAGIVLLLFLAWAFYKPANSRLVSADSVRELPSMSVLEDGDIILRRADGLLSDVARNFSSTEKRFSHVGIIMHAGAGISVIHSIQDEGKGYNGVVSENLQAFMQEARDWAVYRIRLPADIRKNIARKAVMYANESITFDNDFDLNTWNSMYCTELVFHVINESTGKFLIHPGSRVLGKSFISIEDSYRNPAMFLVQQAAGEK